MKEDTDNEFRASLIIFRKEELPADTSGKRHKAPCNRTKRCWPTTLNIVGSCCVRLYLAKSLTGFKL